MSFSLSLSYLRESFRRFHQQEDLFVEIHFTISGKSYILVACMLFHLISITICECLFLDEHYTILHCFNVFIQNS